jgi:hypothetical protein
MIFNSQRVECKKKEFQVICNGVERERENRGIYVDFNSHKNNFFPRWPKSLAHSTVDGIITSIKSLHSIEYIREKEAIVCLCK